MTTKKDSFELNHSYLHYRRTKIIATLGPASLSDQMIKKLIEDGLNIIRINFSHGNPEDHVKNISRIRKISEDINSPVSILADLCGPKIRVGDFEKGYIKLKDGEVVTITTKEIIGKKGIIPSQYPYLAQEVKIGERILLDDGNLELKVTKKLDSENLEALVIRGGKLKNKKGMNLPETNMNISALTDKDKNDLEYILKSEVDYIALSFVRKAKDIKDLKDILKKNKNEIHVIAKIEKPEALDNFNEIIKIADGIMIARGDLGVELPPQKVPIIQNHLIKKTNEHNKPVIVATQMLESMIENSRPTRAEVTDVSSACLAGADAVMLSGETAVGKYPFESYKMMDTVLREAEAHQFFALGGKFTRYPDGITNQVQNAVGTATAQISRDLMVRAIFATTRSGYTARIISTDRPAAPIFALTQEKIVLQKLNLYWGVYPFLVENNMEKKEYIQYAEKIIKKDKLGEKGQYIIMLSGLNTENNETNSIFIHKLR